VLNEIFILSGSSLAISNAHLVTLPVPTFWWVKSDCYYS
jgi:hypothetical protein